LLKKNIRAMLALNFTLVLLLTSAEMNRALQDNNTIAGSMRYMPVEGKTTPATRLACRELARLAGELQQMVNPFKV